MEKKQNNSDFTFGSKSFNLLFTKNELEKKKKLYSSINLSKLPDKGARLKNQIDELENNLKALSLDEPSNDKSKINSYCNVLQNNEGAVSKAKSYWDDKSKAVIYEKCSSEESSKSVVTKEKNVPFGEAGNAAKMQTFSDLTPKQTTKNSSEIVMNSPSLQNWRGKGNERKTLLTEPKPLVENLLSKISVPYHFNLNPCFPTNEECVKKIHHSLVTYPDDTKEESDPENLKALLMMHQKRGLAWLMWREQQDPCGGILADDMGLGKTLTMISLILKQKEKNNYFSCNAEKNESRGTLIVCLASIVHQWNTEITKHCEYNALKVLVYHGSKRNKDFKMMMSYDIVLTTYNIVLSEKKAMNDGKEVSPLFKLKWERIVLDEAHTIKNHASQTAQAIFSLRSFKKWAITGTPIHNVFKDIYSLVKFLQFSPFDDCKKFKVLTNECSESGEQRRNLLMKSIVLRRTKEQVDEWGKPLIEMTDKSICIYFIELSGEERKIYEKLSEKITKKFNQIFEKSSKLRSNSSLLVLLLRLQQCCNHLSLLGKEAEDDDDSTDIANFFSSLAIDDSATTNSSDSSLDLTFNEIETDKLNDKKIKSSKIRELFDQLAEISETSENKDKSVIVSQWVSMLEIVAYHLEQENISYYLIAGNTKVEDRQKFAEDFNYNESGTKIMLLSLKAGGVGLNLIGANHLFLLDLHWNPALEMQACDRIHRVGQKKDVVIHKFVCKNTIEEKIKLLQDEKRGIASSALHGTKQNTKGLSIEDFKELFNVRK